jgi:hypothetical protein
MQMFNTAASQSSDTVNGPPVVDPPPAAPAQAILDQNTGPSGSSSFLSGLVGDKCVKIPFRQSFW